MQNSDVMESLQENDVPNNTELKPRAIINMKEDDLDSQNSELSNPDDEEQELHQKPKGNLKSLKLELLNKD